ncbi:hypothetical protein ACH5RR_031872 [Cinchona calisaya]|uniref:Serine carboxypeptidase n=1 Tax=Cinchona calisaya TaxID=153742 RepID=A0ABD2YJX2_9GENT
MKSALIVFSLTLICLVSFVQCYCGGKKYDPLAKFLKVQNLQQSENYLINEDLEKQYSTVYIGPQEGLKEADKILALPGQPKGLNFYQYSGYVTVDPKVGRALFYYFAESENSSSKPLVLWLNGGPGCSSLGAGALAELGPFRVNRDGKTLWHNERAWNKILGYDPCWNDNVFSYLNNPEVQKSLHANVTGIPGPWDICNPNTVLPTIKRLMASGISIWIYSGDTDAIIPITTTMFDIKKLRVSVTTPWYPWYTQDEVGGYVVGYENLTFVTIRGAGHMVPSTQPARALALFSSFLDGKLPP